MYQARIASIMFLVSLFSVSVFAEQNAKTKVSSKPGPMKPNMISTSSMSIKLDWHTDYSKAYKLAAKEKKLLFIYFYNNAKDGISKKYEKEVLADMEIKNGLQRYVLVKIPTDYQFTKNKKKSKLLKHDAFRHMYDRPGVAMIDLKYKGKSHYGHVVSSHAFCKRFQYGKKETKTIFSLPPGSITQRTMVYAVRMHPDAPQSTHGTPNSMLFRESESHSQHQADINQQGHHNWDSRFQTISSKLGGGLLATEVCAESWAGEELVEAAIECVHCWRQSSGHWRSVSRFHPKYGYDIRMGSNGIWYGTGIFGNND